MTVIGLTGPTGAGKTTALEALEELGFQAVDCDRLYDELLRTSPALREAIAAAFGDVFLPDGGLDRPGLAGGCLPTSGSWSGSTPSSIRRCPPRWRKRSGGARKEDWSSMPSICWSRAWAACAI